MKPLSPSLKLSLIYFSAGVVWILLSDIVANLFFNADNALLTLNIAKGLLFVFLTSFILYFISKYYHKQIKSETLQKVLTEEELVKKSLLLNQVTDTSPVAITMVNPVGNITYANKAAQTLLMLSESKLKEKKFDSPEWKITGIDGEEFPTESLPVSRVTKTKKPVANVRHAIELPSGRTTYLSVNASPLFDKKHQEFLGVVAVMEDITHQVKYEKRLLDSRITYRGILDSVKEAIFIQDKNSVILDVNKRTEEMFGYSRAELVGKTPAHVGDPNKNDFNAITEMISDVIQGNARKMIFWGKKSSGEVFPSEVNLVKGKYFEHTALIAVVRDISERFEMERILRISEKKYRNLFEHNPQPMWIYELKSMKFLDVNTAAIEKYGYTKEEFQSMTITDIRPSEDKELIEDYVQEIREAESTHLDSKVWRHKLKSGKMIYVRILSHRIKLDQKICRLVLANDVTEVIRKERDLIESEQRYKRIFENILDVYYESTLEGKILEMSPSIKLISGGQFTREDLIGKSIVGLYLNKAERDSYVKQLLDSKRVDDFEVNLVNKDGRVINCSVTAKLVDEPSGQKITGTIRDVTVRKEYEQDLISAKEAAEKANQLKTDFLAQISHEIRTPLNIILNSTQLIKDELTEEQAVELSEIYSILKSSGARITRTVESILNMSELQSGSYEPQFTDIKLIGNILKDLVGEYKFLAEQKGIELKLNTDKLDDVLIHADRYSVTQVFANLIDNAVKYTNKGNVIISVEKLNGNALVKVSDSGIGIEDEFLPELFEPFRQEQQGYSREYEGNGLGLALVKKFCELNNMGINVKSKRNEGSTFAIRIPCKQSISQN